MPGLTLWLTSTDEEPDAPARFGAAQRSMVHAPHYSAAVRLNRPGFLLGHVKYPEYPVQYFETAESIVYLEGRVYNKDAGRLESELADIAARALQDAGNALALIKPWALESEGEYIVAIACPARRMCLIFTDPMGRLPLYYYADDTCLLVARECKFIQQLKPRPGFDRIGWAEFLSLRHLVGRRTLFEDVHRAVGAVLLGGGIEHGRLHGSVTPLVRFNFDEKDTSGRSLPDYASELADMFGALCRQRGTHPDVTDNIVSLSGGKDSRVVAAVMAKEGIRCTAATYLDAHGVAKADVAVAEKVAAALGIPWHLFKLPPPSAAEMEFLVRAKDGLNAVANARMLPYLERIVARWGRSAVYISGDGGDRIFPDERLSGRVNSMDDLVRAILSPTAVGTPVDEAEAIMGLPCGTVESELREVVSGYPETDIKQKAIHFRVYERGGNWLYEGEDRSRFFLWQCAPCYSYSLFRYCMLIPDHLKRHDALYRELLKVVSPRCADLPDANLGVALTSRYRPWKHRLKVFVRVLPAANREALRFLLKGRRLPYQVPDELMAALRSHLESQDRPTTIMSPQGVYRRLGRAGRLEFENFWTLVLLEKLAGCG
ncbi:MAG: asparagine synthase-related protein [Planctomycetota bacterium]|jgi:asparagine synthase (glutamine-hydrolysing)